MNISHQNYHTYVNYAFVIFVKKRHAQVKSKGGQKAKNVFTDTDMSDLTKTQVNLFHDKIENTKVHA